MNEEQMKSFMDMANGGFKERVDYEMPAIIRNILDPNTPAKFKRKLTITVEFVVDDTRQNIAANFVVKSTLAPTNKGKQYPIKLADGLYIIRKLTVTECKRLQTVPEEYIFPVSDTQAYKMLGNGWTVDVIAHILHYAPGITTEPLEVLSMYDGMSCGRLALDKLGAHIAHYYATEIDKYAIKTTQHNFPDTIQLGDVFQVRGEGWSI